MLRLYNTLTRQKEIFEPIHPPFVGIYVCGPTVYDDPHLGHAKSYVSFDVIVRFLRVLGYRVRYVQNITDVGHLLDEGGEDRVIKRARLEQLEPVEVAQKYENRYFQAMDRLNNLRPNISCRASGHIPEMIEMIETLLSKGFAYEAGGNVYFDVRKFQEYGKLSRRSLEELKEAVRVEKAEGKRFFADFALWKKADPSHLMQWRSPWGKGFPGWHLECSVMSMKYLGESFDIHGGGLDNQFPHHECEIAQSEAATGKPFVKYWLHNNMVTVNGQKMSKSLGNFVTLSDLFERFHPMTVRFFILQGHYRSPQDFSDEALGAAAKGFEKLKRFVHSYERGWSGDGPLENQEKVQWVSPWSDFRDRFFSFMEDDFNTAGALTVLFDVVSFVQNSGSLTEEERRQCRMLFSLAENVLGLRFEDQEREGETYRRFVELVEFLITLRQEFREKKRWEVADRIREGLFERGVILEDTGEGARWRLKES